MRAARYTTACLAIASLVAAVFSMASFAGTASASEGIESFGTTLIETHPETRTILAGGEVQEIVNGEKFTMHVVTGALNVLNADYSVEVPPTARYVEAGRAESSFEDIAPGDYVEVFGRSTEHVRRWLEGTEIIIRPAVSGLVESSPSGESFSIEPLRGPASTVEVSPSTEYFRAESAPGVDPPTLTNVVPGDHVEVLGNVSGSSVNATGIVISTPQAGGHPDLRTTFSLEAPGQPEAAHNVIFNAPTGVFGNPRAITQCVAADFTQDQCPPDSQAGLITVYANYKGNPHFLLGTAPLFAMMPQQGETARFSFVVPTLGIPIAIPVAVRTATDYGLRFTVRDISQQAPLSSANLIFWGYPAEKSHNLERFPKGTPGEPTGCPLSSSTNCITEPTLANIAPQPLIDNPTTCSGERPVSTLEVQTYQDPTHLSKETATYPPIAGCQKEVFNPVLQAGPTTKETDSASGLELDLKSPQFLTFASEPSEIKAVKVTLPEGFTVNPDAADGQSECREVQANFGSEGPAECPDSAKIGTFSIGTPALPERLEGSVYIGEPKPGDQYRLYMTASGFGINAKIVGSIKPDPATGRLSAEFLDLPQAPFEDFELHLFSGERSLMATPPRCDLYQVSAEFIPWNSALAEQQTSQSFLLESGPHGSFCPAETRPFHPTLDAGTTNATAGAHSAFHLELDREDGDQFLGHLGFTMPPGLTADLRGVGYCPETSIAAAAENAGRAELAVPSCPGSSLIGSSNVAAGPGSHPFHAVGKVYLAGPFQGAPLSLVVITPALAGPYDYGTVVVRVAIHVDPLDAHVTADSEAIPKIIGGIPLRIRQIRVNIDRSDAAGNPNFMLNPTSCQAQTVGSDGIGDEGTKVAFTSPFQAVNCETLPFKPKMTIKQLGGGKATKRGTDPGLQFDLTTRTGDANIKSVAVTLPTALEVDPNHLANLCTEKELVATSCAGRQPIGTATDATPQLDQPLGGKVYAVTGSGGLPHLAFVLDGQVDLVPRAESETTRGQRLKTTVPVIPDAQIGHFHLVLLGGKHGYLTNTRSLCGRPPSIEVALAAQNGKSRIQKIKLKPSCGHKRSGSQHHAGRR